jgi:hypothetical protein
MVRICTDYMTNDPSNPSNPFDLWSILRTRIKYRPIHGSTSDIFMTRRMTMAEYHLRIKELPPTEQPRERLRDQGAAALSDAELLAIRLFRLNCSAFPHQ